MVCQRCGNPVQGAFCSSCGAPVVAPPAAYGPPPVIYAPPRVERHVQTLGILWCVFGAYRLVVGLIGSAFLLGMAHIHRFDGMTPWSSGELPFGSGLMAGLGSLVIVLVVILSVLSFLTGFALLTRKPWGRVLAIVVAILTLIKIPFGTALGIYTLWVLAPAASAAEWDATAQP
jgi:hypothetical protein